MMMKVYQRQKINYQFNAFREKIDMKSKQLRVTNTVCADKETTRCSVFF